ncbi:MAG: M23 family metallopeptidase [Nitrospirae bacterium]|nr:M23 family metallopeptidase [Nitrospirota bacterium]
MKRVIELHGLFDQRCSGFGRIGLLLTLPFVLIIAFAAYQLFFIPTPEVKGIEAFNYLSADKTIKFNGENIESIEISISQDGRKFDLLKDTPQTKSKSYSLQIKPKIIGTKDGKARITIMAKAGMIKKARYDIEAVIDTTPPEIDVVAAPQFIYPGTGAFSILKASGEDSVFIKLADKARSTDDKTFKAFKMSSGPDSKDSSSGQSESATQRSTGQAGNIYYVFFPAAYDIDEGSIFYAVATDMAGNRSIKTLPTKIKITKYSASSINIDDAFIKRVVSPLLNETNISDTAQAFKKVNEELRQQSLNKLLEIAQQTEPKVLWEGNFIQLKNSKVMATYGDRRTYLYNGTPISKSVHLGYDLASVEKAPVEASNTGIVKYAGDLSIYGNTVIIDHGLGFMSIYGHLSAIMVNEGQKVSKGEIIAKSGATGLAGGDHLHFGLLMHGYEVSPLYWWDPHWIQVNVTDLIQQERANLSY